ncbi:hypothetical protein AB6A40_000844 [Gnathostoma spinigerum]|uniref:Uncharacterized protein n=1 Tax=Gnathostoma spinigerum TaxID=75299 RepID=A0ABD6E2V6_9BILA
MDGSISALQASPDHIYMAVAVRDENISEIVVMDAAKRTTAARYHVTHDTTQLRISSGNEVLVAFKADKLIATISTVTLLEGKMKAHGTVVTEQPTHYWQVSLCPTDDELLCVLADNVAFLLRCSSGIIDTFSKIECTGALCHEWVTDGVLAFGDENTQIHLFRGTHLLSTVDLQAICHELQYAKQSNIVLLVRSNERLLSLVDDGLILIFSLVRGEYAWQFPNAIIMHSSSVPGELGILCQDTSGNNFLYGDGRFLWKTSLRNADAERTAELFLVAAKHTHPVISVYCDESRQTLISLDNSGFIIVTAAHSQFFFCPHFILTSQYIGKLTLFL